MTRLFGALAQMVERGIRIAEATGSNPVCSTKIMTSTRKRLNIFHYVSCKTD